MNRNRKRVALVAAAVVVLLAGGSCNDINRQSSPVDLIVTNTQILRQIDLNGDIIGSQKCQGNTAVVHILALQLQPPSTNPRLTPIDLNQVKIDRYRVSYNRADGGHLVPAPFVRSTSTLVGINSTAEGTNFALFDANAINLAPFAALKPENGGRDPETGRPIISLDVTLELFGTTLAGERVSGNTRMTLDFCFSCGGCF
ncbi:MAG TPA: hypothetical protein VER58_09490 [Thermoanaerobaculia bacterium]|nr:hypothetical protein [Thermoanaerobaculia bacterium]